MCAGGEGATRAGVGAGVSATGNPQGEGLILGAFAYVANNRFVAAKHSTTSPRFWVGRVVEIKRGGKIRLHWFKETKVTLWL